MLLEVTLRKKTHEKLPNLVPRLTFYEIPKSFEEIFNMFSSGTFPIYKEKYIIGYFGNKMMYLEAYGWKGLPATAEVFKLENRLVC